MYYGVFYGDCGDDVGSFMCEPCEKVTDAYNVLVESIPPMHSFGGWYVWDSVTHTIVACGEEYPTGNDPLPMDHLTDEEYWEVVQ